MAPLGVLALLAAVSETHEKGRAPLSYLSGAGDKAYPVVALTWGLLIISVAVIVIVTALVVVGIIRRNAGATQIEAVTVERGGNGLRWVGIGVGISSVVLLGSLIWTVAVLAAVNAPPRPAPLTIEITAQQWWWKARYLTDDASRVLTTANEIHIPAGQPVRIQLIGADVIHSFWVPALSGKTDTIPGQTNVTWIEATKPGRYEGQCTEYCGQQHAHMGFFIVADAPDDFKAWWDAQLRPASDPSDETSRRGEAEFVSRCGACHTVRGTEAGGTVAPELTHLMSRATLAANTVPNTPGNLAGWIADPQTLKPGTEMPVLYLSGHELGDIEAYLETLK